MCTREREKRRGEKRRNCANKSGASLIQSRRIATANLEPDEILYYTSFKATASSLAARIKIALADQRWRKPRGRLDRSNKVQYFYGTQVTYASARGKNTYRCATQPQYKRYIMQIMEVGSKIIASS